jgi:putative PIN family toxin of toxin-antitoxin system
MKYFAIIDTNIVVSALLSNKNDSATVQIMEKVLRQEIIPVYSKEIFAEYVNVLNRPKFHFSKNLVDYMLSAIKKFGILKEPNEKNEIILPDMKDVPFYRLVLESENTYLVTGNLKHFPQEQKILTARQLLDILENQN